MYFIAHKMWCISFRKAERNNKNAKFTTKFLEYSFFFPVFFFFFSFPPPPPPPPPLLFSFGSFCCHIFKLRVSFLSCFHSTNESIEDLLVLLISNIFYCFFCIIYIFCLCYSIFAYCLLFPLKLLVFKKYLFLAALRLSCGMWHIC